MTQNDPGGIRTNTYETASDLSLDWGFSVDSRKGERFIDPVEWCLRGLIGQNHDGPISCLKEA